jgi:lysophospholipase L1-like esterase
MKIYSLIIVSMLILTGCKSANSMNKNTKKIIIFTIGDSTMANKKDPEKNPERGWVQVLVPFFKENVTIKNHAVNGRRPRVFGNWDIGKM